MKERKKIFKNLIGIDGYTERVRCCLPDELPQILNKIESDPNLTDKKKGSLRIRIAKRPDIPENVLKKLEKDENGEVKFWARDTKQRRIETEGPKLP